MQAASPDTGLNQGGMNQWNRPECTKSSRSRTRFTAVKRFPHLMPWSGHSLKDFWPLFGACWLCAPNLCGLMA